jgi:hypothetical protein
MSIRDEATRREIEAEFARGLSPLGVEIEWSYGDLLYKVEGRKQFQIPRTEVGWERVLAEIRTIRRTILRKGVKLDPWELPLSV